MLPNRDEIDHDVHVLYNCVPNGRISLCACQLLCYTSARLCTHMQYSKRDDIIIACQTFISGCDRALQEAGNFARHSVILLTL